MNLAGSHSVVFKTGSSRVYEHANMTYAKTVFHLCLTTFTMAYWAIKVSFRYQAVSIDKHTTINEPAVSLEIRVPWTNISR